jgi:uncharacterized protein (DUF1501 family)
MNRRSFLKTSAAGAAIAPIMLGGMPVSARTSLAALAQMPADNDRILVIIQLFGGNDGLNTVLPMHDEDEYLRIRPRIGVAKKDAWNYQETVYLHPALTKGSKGGMGRLLENGSLAIIQGVGYDNPNLSHFRSTDIWLSGINDSNPNVRLDTGWIGRFLEERYPAFPQSLPEHPLAVQMGGFSLTLLSSKGRMGIEVTDPAQQKSLTPQLDSLDPESAGTAYEFEYAFVADIANRSNRYAAAVRDAYNVGKTKLKGQYASDGFATQMASVAALIAGGLRTKVFVVSMGGFDTHFTQQIDPASGAHPMLLGRLGDAVGQFMHDMTQLGEAQRVVGMTVSEFGRRPEENGSFGTDHGAASVQFVFGSEVNSGVFGLPADLRNLNENGDLIYQVDYREVYAEILTDWFGMTTEEMRAVLQSETVRPIDVIQAQSSRAPRDGEAYAAARIGAIAPNPFVDNATISIRLPRPAHATVTITSARGERIATIVDAPMAAGAHRIAMALDVAPGTYFCTLETGTERDTQVIHCVR